MLVTTFDRTIPKDWSNCLDRRQVWNQKRPPWFEAIQHTIYPLLTPIVNILVSSMQTGATIYQVSVRARVHSQLILSYKIPFDRQWRSLSPV